MIEVKADKWTMKQDSFSAWQILRHGEPCKVSPDNCHSALAWELAYASGQEPLPEPVLVWDDWTYEGTEYSKSAVADGNIKLYLYGLRWRLSSWSTRFEDWVALAAGNCASIREGKVLCEAALRKYWWDKLMPKGTDR